LPHPPQPFNGKIGRTAAESTPDFPKGIEAPKGAPNVLLILTDDVGFSAASTFGGPIPTPTFDKLCESLFSDSLSQRNRFNSLVPQDKIAA